MEFKQAFTKVGSVMNNHDAYKQLKAQYMKKGYTEHKARYAALGCMSGRSQGSTCKWYRQNGQVYFERLA